MQPSWAVDFSRGLVPRPGAAFGQHGALSAPVGPIDPVRGLRFPLREGACVVASGGAIDDGAGSLELVFRLAAPIVPGPLVQAWGQYEPLLRLCAGTLDANLYGHRLQLWVRWQLEVPYTLTLHWDHRVGVALRLSTPGEPVQAWQRRLTWPAWHQAHVPLALGGMASEPRYRAWSGIFSGWLQRATVWAAPLEIPGPGAIGVAGEALAAPFAHAPGVTVLAVNDPPIRPDPYHLVQWPDRLEDLRRTREVARLDELLAHCRGQVEQFTALTSQVARMWPHCNYWPWAPDRQRDLFWQRGHELVPAIRAGQAGGMCGGYAHVMEELCWALGYEARRIQVSDHSAFEAHLPEQDRWVICEASTNHLCHLVQNTAGHCLGADELIRRCERLDHDPEAFADVRLRLCRDENLVEAPTEFAARQLALYDQVGLAIDKAREFGLNAASDRGSSPYAWYLRAPERAAFRPQDMGCGNDNVLVDRLDDLYPSRHRVQVAWQWTTPGQVLAAQLRAVATPAFASFLASVDEAAWAPCGAGFSWSLHPGVNTLELRTRNHLGALGYIYRLTVHLQP